MATETNNVEQYIDIEGLRQLLNLIKQTYVCQKGLTSKVREQIYSILETIGSNAVVKQTYNDTRTDPYEIAKDFRDYTWKNADLLCVENPDGHMSVFYWNNALWVCLTKAPVNEINIDDTEENLKKIVPTASAVVKIVDEKIDAAFGAFAPDGDGGLKVDIATDTSAGIVMASEEIAVNPTSGLMSIKAVPVGKITGFDDKVKELTYLKEEINHILLSSSSASDMASFEVYNINQLNQIENISKPAGTVSNIINNNGDVLETYILEETINGKVWVKLDENATKSISEKLAELEERADGSGTWYTF